jgi:hypothetical protein
MAYGVQTDMLEQLGDLVRKGLLEWQTTQPVLTQDPTNPCKINMSSTGRLVLKDREKFEQLEKELAEARARLSGIQAALRGIL